jgi:hypothetical protein
VSGAVVHVEPGVFMSFDERVPDLGVNVASLDFDLPGLEARKLLATDYVHLDRQELHETGEYDLEGLFVRLNAAVSRVGAKRVVLDSIDTLFAGIPMKRSCVRNCAACLFGSRTRVFSLPYCGRFHRFRHPVLFQPGAASERHGLSNRKLKL